jgi:hypothetical protein
LEVYKRRCGPLENVSQAAVEHPTSRGFYAKKSGSSEARIVGILREAEMDANVAVTGSKHGVIEPIYCR